ncbi:probable L-cysteine desulfhydrase, chloroplastic [Patiria miniata]|uniref:Aminotransferase class V domain-containing protein n=1 Tax=Patiria miniata TaxID=46514 RepID=A0A913Z2U4_PATMI|nr:probable L-cysteine desulfhydrase, chloroplastic [Patiria miniata]
MKPVEVASSVAVGIFSAAGLVWGLQYYSRKRQAAKKAFGRELRQAEYCFAEDFCLCNNGSFAAVPRPILQLQQRLIAERERKPALWYRRQYDPKWFPSEGGHNRYAQAVMAVAEFVGAKSENLVLVENTTTGINCVLQNLPLTKGDKILLTTHGYGSFIKTVQYVCEKTGSEAVVLEIPVPIESEDDIVKLYADALEQHSNIKVAVIDHITCPSAILMPMERLAALCQQKDVLVLVDGAHAPGQVPLNLEQLPVDFYVGNLHKWLFSPRGCALLWVHPSHHDSIRHVITSHSTYAPTLMERFCFIGTRDNIPYYCATAAIKFHHDLGGLEAITAYNASLCGWAADMLAKAWSTEQLAIPAHMRAPFMAIVAVPETDAYPACPESCGKLMGAVFSHSGVIAAFSHFNERLWCRLSSHVYNCQDDYYKLRDAVLQVMQIDQ